MSLLIRTKFRFWQLKRKAKKVYLENPLPGKFKRIYHFHIRKSAGTSVNAAFWNLAGLDLNSIWKKSLIVTNDKVFVRHHYDLIQEGNYTFANSHLPFWKIKLPPETLTFSVFRDPVQRIVSLYRYYHFNVNHPEAHLLDPMNSSVKQYAHWLGNSFGDFLENIPRQHSVNQVYMFSENFNVEEALLNLSKLSYVFFQDDLDMLPPIIEKETSLKPELKRERAFPVTTAEITDIELNKARSILADEILLFNKLKELYSVKPQI